MSERWLNIALPKGRLGERVYDLLERAGYACPEIRGESRKLIFANEERKVRYFWAKPSDVPVYVERGSADLGIAGRDILREHRPDVYDLLDLGFGKCSMCVAGPKDFREDPDAVLRVATKFPHIARDYYTGRGRDIELIQLNGSIELAPIVGLSDVIVDIVESGKTLRENGLCVFETILPISARLIANKVSYKFSYEEIRRLLTRVGGLLGEEAER